MSSTLRFINELSQPDRNATLRAIRRGLEKESLRVMSDGSLAQTAHPLGLGSALTHPYITTDYSEALLEFITPPFDRTADLLAELDRLHRFTYAELSRAGEQLWPASMPYGVERDEAIPVARYGSSNAGRFKTVYRIGLGHRYGRSMQTIAGIHYNFSLPDTFWTALQALEGNTLPLDVFKTERYFDLIRNFRRYFWILIYWFGASPAVAAPFVADKPHQLIPTPFASDTFYLPYATSLRMGNLGYQSDVQTNLSVSYNTLSAYLQDLTQAITQSHPVYESIGITGEEGDYRQLNTSILQIENEFYSSIRPKRTAKSGETALQALDRRGVEYIEVRCVDVNPDEPLGITEAQIQTMDAFLLYCLLQDSPLTDADEALRIQENQRRIVERGRDPSLTLRTATGERAFSDWAAEILAGCTATAQLLDHAQGGSAYQTAISEQAIKIANSETTPSAKVLATMQMSGQSIGEQHCVLAAAHHDYFTSRLLDANNHARLAESVNASHAQQNALEAMPQAPFDEYLKEFYERYANVGRV